MNIVAHNILAMNAQRMYGINTNSKKKSAEKLSSGYKINRAADDAAGLSISEKMRKRIRGLNQGADNLKDGVSLCQTADGALMEVEDMIHRMNELAIKAANGTNSQSDREDINNEISELKDEMTRVFDTTKFNELYIFRAPYVPDVEGIPNDIQVFSSTGSDGYGGVLVNHIRYTWEELGIKLSPDGRTFDDNSITLQVWNGVDANNEELHLYTTKGSSLNDIHRIYKWTAGEDGIYVNNIHAATWEEMGLSTENPAGKAKFNYHGMTISFKSEAGSIGSLIEAINGDNIDEVSWETTAPMAVDKNAVGTTTAPASYVIDSSNKDNVLLPISQIPYTIHVDEDGVWLTDSSGTTYTKKNWEEFQNIDSGEPSYPLQDWGIDNNGPATSATQEDETLDDTAHYQYSQDILLGSDLSLTFDIKDEASRDVVIQALNGSNWTQKIQSLMKASVGSSSSGLGGVSLSDSFQQYTSETDYESFAFQRDILNRTFASGGVESAMQNLPVERPAGTVVTYVPYTINPEDTDWAKWGKYVQKKDAEGNLQYEMEDDGITRKKDGEGNDIPVMEWEYENLTALQIRGLSEADFAKLKDSSQNGPQALTYSGDLESYKKDCLGYRSFDGTLSVTVGGATFTSGHLSNRFYIRTDDPNNIYLDDSNTVKASNRQVTLTCTTDSAKKIYLKDYKYSTDSQKITLAGNGNAGLNLSYTRHDSFQSETKFGIKVNPPKKRLDLQATDVNLEREREILEWNPLSNSILGLSNANTKSIDSARATIGAIEGALQTLNFDRSVFGAYQNRLEHAIKINDNTSENTQAAESIIRDTDMEKELVHHSIISIMMQAGEAMMTQANQSNQGVLSLIA